LFGRGDLAVGRGDRVLRLQELLVEDVGALAVRVDLGLESLGLVGLRGELALRRRARGEGDGRRAEGETKGDGEGEVPGPEESDTAVGANAPPRHGRRC
jgi:hypothetical protein